MCGLPVCAGVDSQCSLQAIFLTGRPVKTRFSQPDGRSNRYSRPINIPFDQLLEKKNTIPIAYGCIGFRQSISSLIILSLVELRKHQIDP